MKGILYCLNPSKSAFMGVCRRYGGLFLGTSMGFKQLYDILLCMMFFSYAVFLFATDDPVGHFVLFLVAMLFISFANLAMWCDNRDEAGAVGVKEYEKNIKKRSSTAHLVTLIAHIFMAIHTGYYTKESLYFFPSHAHLYLACLANYLLCSWIQSYSLQKLLSLKDQYG